MSHLVLEPPPLVQDHIALLKDILFPYFCSYSILFKKPKIQHEISIIY